MCTFEYENIMNRGIGIDIVDVNYHFHKLFGHIQCDEYQINGNSPAKFEMILTNGNSIWASGECARFEMQKCAIVHAKVRLH